MRGYVHLWQDVMSGLKNISVNKPKAEKPERGLFYHKVSNTDPNLTQKLFQKLAVVGRALLVRSGRS
jgi:hypothetical protein